MTNSKQPRISHRELPIPFTSLSRVTCNRNAEITCLSIHKNRRLVRAIKNFCAKGNPDVMAASFFAVRTELRCVTLQSKRHAPGQLVKVLAYGDFPSRAAPIERTI